ncbi:MAG TPA: type II toxin-antitoxin system PemK/MazF family toxin [Verrucomicrobiae bacterium]
MSRPGEIWLAEIPFTNGAASKIRPVLILWIDAGDAVVAAITSTTPRSQTDFFSCRLESGGIARGVHRPAFPIGLSGTNSLASKARHFVLERRAKN